MNHRVLASLVGVVLLIAVVAESPLPGQKKWTPAHTPDGQPDLQGIWGFATITPLERPSELAGKQFFTEKEAVEYEKQFLTRNNRDRRDGPTEADVSRAYNDFWWDSGNKVVSTRRTSLITDPPDVAIGPVSSLASADSCSLALLRQYMASSLVSSGDLHGCMPLGDSCPIFNPQMTLSQPQHAQV